MPTPPKGSASPTLPVSLTIREDYSMASVMGAAATSSASPWARTGNGQRRGFVSAEVVVID
jgi:hypothetical protein